MLKSIVLLCLLVQASFGLDLWKIFDKSTTTPQYSWDGGQFAITWKIENDVLTLTMKGKTAGWISCGICKSTSMRECDFWTGWVVDSTNDVILLDTWSTGDSRPKTDSQGDLTLLNATQSNGETSITFSRPLKTGDSGQDYDIQNILETVGWATHTKDGASPNKYSEHNKAGWIYINFVTGETSAVSKIDPGMLLAIIVVGILLLWAVVHTSKKLFKMYQRYQLQQAMESKPQTTVQSMETTTDTKDIQLQDMKNGKQIESENERDLEYASAKEPVVPVCNSVDGIVSARLPYLDTTVGMILVFLAYCGLNIGCLYYSPNRFSAKVGDILAANVFFVTVPATRNSVLVYLLGVPFDKAVTFHRWLGRFTLALGITHFGLMLGDWKQAAEIKSNIAELENIYGLVALGILVFMFVTSLNWIRRRGFEFFYYLHYVFIAFWIFSFLHHEKMQPWVGASVGVYAIDKLVRFMWGTLPQDTTDFKIKGNGEDKVLQVRVKKSQIASLLHLYDVGQYVFVNFPKVSLFEWHPFSISSSPAETTLEFHIKGIGNYTEKLLEAASSAKSLSVRVEGPYGALEANYRRFPVVVLVGGGIGVTPLIGMLKDLAGTGKVDPHYFGGKSFVKKLHFVWVVRTMTVYEWFAEEIQDALRALASTGTEAQVSIYVTRSKSLESTNAMFHVGRPAFGEIFKHITDEAQGNPTGVFVCGPQPMIEDVWDTVNKHRRHGETIHFHRETFEL